jgi:hypothetical protein
VQDWADSELISDSRSSYTCYRVHLSVICLFVSSLFLFLMGKQLNETASVFKSLPLVSVFGLTLRTIALYLHFLTDTWLYHLYQRFVIFIQIRTYQPFKAYRCLDAPTGLTFNNSTFCPHCIYVFCIYLRTNTGFWPIIHKLLGFCNQDEKCLLRGTNWIFK